MHATYSFQMIIIHVQFLLSGHGDLLHHCLKFHVGIKFQTARCCWASSSSSSSSSPASSSSNEAIEKQSNTADDEMCITQIIEVAIILHQNGRPFRKIWMNLPSLPISSEWLTLRTRRGWKIPRRAKDGFRNADRYKIHGQIRQDSSRLYTMVITTGRHLSCHHDVSICMLSRQIPRFRIEWNPETPLWAPRPCVYCPGKTAHCATKRLAPTFATNFMLHRVMHPEPNCHGVGFLP